MTSDLTRPIIGIENRTPQEVFDIMCDRIRHTRTPIESDELVEKVARAILEARGFGFYDDPIEGGQDAYDITLEVLGEARSALSAFGAETAIERVAMAIHRSAARLNPNSHMDAWDKCGPTTKGNFRQHARAAISAISEDGYGG